MEATITAWATVVLAVLTAFYVWLTYRILRSQSDPCVIVYLQVSAARHGYLEIIVENIGRGLARDIRFEMNEPIPAFPPSQELEIAYGPLRHGIAALQPGGKRVVIWGSYPQIKESLGAKQLTVTCRFKRAESGPLAMNDDLEPCECVLDHFSFDRTSAARGWEADLVDAVERIAAAVVSTPTIPTRKL